MSEKLPVQSAPVLQHTRQVRTPDFTVAMVFAMERTLGEAQ